MNDASHTLLNILFTIAQKFIGCYNFLQGLSFNKYSRDFVVYNNFKQQEVTVLSFYLGDFSGVVA